MNISLAIVSNISKAIDGLEHLRLWIGGTLLGVFLLEVLLAVTFLRFLTTGFLAGFILQLAGLVWLSLQLQKRKSLLWQSRRLLEKMREPGTLFVSKWFKDFVRYKRLGAVILIWALATLSTCPYLHKIYDTRLFHFSQSTIESAKSEFFYSLWTVHATVLGVFLVLLTFLFQFISLRLAYETSLLPFLAHKSHLSSIITMNFFFIGFGMIQGLIGEQNKWQPTFRWVMISGLIFALLSAAFLLHRLLDLLRPEAVEDGLLELVKQDLIKEIEEDRLLAIAQALLQQECEKWSLEYSIFDIYTSSLAIYSKTRGEVADIFLDRLSKLSKHLTGPIKPGPGLGIRAIVLRRIGDEVTDDLAPLARISMVDHNDQNEALIRKVFGIRDGRE